MAEANPADEKPTVVWSPQERQRLLISCPVFEALYGGARGGGKTDGVLGDFAAHAGKYGKDAIGLMVRRERTQLVETIERSRQIYGPTGARYNEQDKMWRFPNGARLRFAYLERDADAEAYQGHSYTRVYIEEIGNFPTSTPVMKLMATLRSPAGVPVGFRATGNPGGPGHSWVKQRYIDPFPGGWQTIHDERAGLDRVFIPSKIADNRYLGDDYVARLRMSGSDALVRAWLEGDWSAIEGAFFDKWSGDRHIVEPFAVPPHWLRFRSMDWGFASPSAIYWWAVAGENHVLPDGRVIPRGCLVAYREWYPKQLIAEDLAAGILDREADDGEISYGVLDPSAFANQGGPSHAERMGRAGVIWRQADNKRVAQIGALSGWDYMRARIQGDEEGRAMIVFFDHCVDAIRTIPLLQHDPDRPEDLLKSPEDHAADSVRYACMSRPWVREAQKVEPFKVNTKLPSLGEIAADIARQARDGARRI